MGSGFFGLGKRRDVTAPQSFAAAPPTTAEQGNFETQNTTADTMESAIRKQRGKNSLYVGSGSGSGSGTGLNI